MKVPVSFIVPVKNEEANISQCLRSIAWADQVFVVDSASIDKTREIAESLKAEVVQFKFTGTWPKKKNWALGNLPLKHEWVFILDADEVLPPEAEEEIREICMVNRQGFDGYFINRRFMFMGKWLKHAYYPNWNLRLFRHKLGRYEKLTEANTRSGDNEVHEHILLKGKTGYLKSEMDHYAFPDVETFVEKHNRYSNWEAALATDRSKPEVSMKELQSKAVMSRRFLKNIAAFLPFRPLLRFVYVYVLQRGFLDGKEGYYFARLHAFYEFLCVCKVYEIDKKQRSGGQSYAP